MEQDNHMKVSAFVAVVGRPSAGKSTLVNTLCGQKVSIVSAVPQTTRNSIRGILSEDRGQIVFIDTPGFHDSDKKFNKKLGNLVQGAIDDCDLVLYVIDATRPVGLEERAIMDMLAKTQVPIIAGINKIDLCANQKSLRLQVQETESSIKALLSHATILEFSALHKQGIDKIKQEIFDRSPRGSAWYPPEFYTDQEPTFRIAEIIREQIMNRTREEIPHASYVEIEDLELSHAPGGSYQPGHSSPESTNSNLSAKDTIENELVDIDATTVVEQSSSEKVQDLWDLCPAKRPKLWIHARIHVERDSQKGIIIGKDGSLIRTIRLESERELREIFPYRIALELKVKVSPKWRNNDTIITHIIY